MWVRRNAIDALGVYGSQAQGALSGLKMAMLVDSSSRVRHNAALTIARIGLAAEGLVPALQKSLNDESPCVRSNAALALKQIGTPEAKQILSTVPELTGGGRYASK
jgi:HEAT repeat protein